MIHFECESGLSRLHTTPLKELFCYVTELTHTYSILKIKGKAAFESELQAMKVCRECEGDGSMYSKMEVSGYLHTDHFHQ
jgi:hypothetical protein